MTRWSALCPALAAGVLILTTAFRLPDSPSPNDPPGKDAPGPALDSAQAAFVRSLRSLTSPELERRKAARRSLQQEGYAEILDELLAGDPVAALLSWFRVRLQLEYSIPSRPLFVYAYPPAARRDTSLAGRMLPSGGIPVAIPLVEDRSFPANPWHQPKNTEER